MPEFDPNTPSVARVYDYALGGKDNYQADRDVAERLLSIVPLIREMAIENRQFLSRAATWAAGQGIGQFIDLGCGLPTKPSTHESAQAVLPGARVTYVDNDPVVVRHLQALLAQGNPGVSVLDADVRDAGPVLDGVRASLDTSAPACLTIGYLLHFYPAAAARDLLGRYVSALAPGSVVVLSVLHYEGDAAQRALATYSSEVTPLYLHTAEEVAGFFGPLDLVPPGLVDARSWYQDQAPGAVAPRDGFVLAGVARKR